MIRFTSSLVLTNWNWNCGLYYPFNSGLVLTNQNWNHELLRIVELGLQMKEKVKGEKHKGMLSFIKKNSSFHNCFSYSNY
jgi:hypothetical protein